MRCPISFHTRRAAFAALFADLAPFKRAQNRSPTTWDGGFEVDRATGLPVHDLALMHRARRPAAEMSCSTGEVL